MLAGRQNRGTLYCCRLCGWIYQPQILALPRPPLLPVAIAKASCALPLDFALFPSLLLLSIQVIPHLPRPAATTLPFFLGRLHFPFPTNFSGPLHVSIVISSSCNRRPLALIPQSSRLVCTSALSLPPPPTSPSVRSARNLPVRTTPPKQFAASAPFRARSSDNNLSLL